MRVDQAPVVFILNPSGLWSSFSSDGYHLPLRIEDIEGWGGWLMGQLEI